MHTCILSTEWVDCGGAHEISGIPAPLWLHGWVVGGFMGWMGGGCWCGWCACEGWVGEVVWGVGGWVMWGGGLLGVWSGGVGRSDAPSIPQIAFNVTDSC